MDRVFLDANVLSSSAYSPQASLRVLWQLPQVVLLSSAYAIEEALRNLDDSDQRTRLDELLRSVEVVAEKPSSEAPTGITLREKDVPILLAAIHGGASHLLTGDVRDFGTHFERRIGGVLILRPRDYITGRQRQPT